ncbi:FAD-dependent oxidoreductase [Leucobacter sp. GX24907]
MAQHFDQIVIGGGAMGLSTTWHLAKRGAKVLLLERFAAGHTRGASHGATRNMNPGYDDPDYLDLFEEANGLYSELEETTGTRLIERCGLVNHGDPERVLPVVAQQEARGFDVERLSADEAARRWPGMRFEGEVTLSRQAGRIMASRVLETLASEAEKYGADIRFEHRVLEFDVRDDRVVVSVLNPSGGFDYFEADGIVVTAGAWSSQLLAGVVDLPRLTVTEEHPAHFQVRPEFAEHEAAWPSFTHRLNPEQLATYGAPVYGMLSPGEGIKVGFHKVGPEIEADGRSFRGSDERRAELRDYVEKFFPGLDPDSAEEISCTYTTSERGQFVLDRVGRVTVGAGFAGEGFKFVPAIGRVLADAALGTALPPERFRLDAHR